MSEVRPNPDELLEQVEQQQRKAQRGTLKVFFGMAAGVGKTYAMLEEARARAAEGTDVLIGYAEPHIRPETEAILLGMDILPYRIVEYRGTTLKEFDLDAALARRPSLILVDELAHTNAAGMRHQKRWQDVMELLDAGVSVFTTLNVQHLESVNDIVERITGVKVRETLPDSVLEQADEVELVDIAPEELLQRFHEGKVYRPDQAERAAAHFFTKGNLIALRELALRTTAQRVDAQMQAFRKAHAITGLWAATERVLVCVGPSPMSRRLVRAARRLAAGLRADFITAYVETPAAQALSANDRRRLELTLQLAEQLGARIVNLSGQNVADELLAYAQAHNVTKIVIGKPQRPRWREFLFPSVVDELVRRAGDIDVYIIRAHSEDVAMPAEAPPPRQWDMPGHLTAIAVCALATLAGYIVYHYLKVANENVLMLYLLGVLWVAARHSRGAAALASILAVAAFDFCFVPPYFTFAVADQQYLATFAVMLVTALLISTLTHRVRFQADAARSRERRTAALYALARDLASAASQHSAVESAAHQLSSVTGGRVVVLLPDDNGHIRVAADSEPQLQLDQKELSVAQWAMEHAQPAGDGTMTLPAAAGLYLPLQTGESVLGALGVFEPAAAGTFRADQRQLIEAFASQVAVAIKRTRAEEDARQAWERVESELLRNTLLSGVSHELRTPLAAITGAVSALQEPRDLTEDTRVQLLRSIADEADRMERLITNLLDMTRLESGGLVMKKDWQDIREIIASAVRRMDRHLHGREVSMFLPEDLPLVQADAVAMEQVLMNLLDNAVQYTPAASPLEIRAAGDSELVVEVSDHGPGLVPGTEKRVFEKFFRSQPAANRRGIGLGLAICKGIIEAHGGTISAMNRVGGGAVFRFTLPLPLQPPKVDRTL